ncbi:uncharacterized protein LOC133825730 [Humulus lupulus]|uniref:uncharacterized protein LOC133825730 n=1 Tax=Humulus lupulus TaxID=3486 RepID=UPI002B414CB0|nr:uncharacterized protein LOC133825730 [Humulus lupulus]
MENHNQSCTAVPQTAPGPSVCMGVAHFGDDDERVEGCSSSDDNSEDRFSMLHVVQVDNLNVRPLPRRQESQGRRTASSESSRPTTQAYGNRWSSPAYTVEDIPCPSYVIPTLFGVSCGVIEVGKLFENKLELKTKAHLYAMKQNFEFVVKKSDRIECVHGNNIRDDIKNDYGIELSYGKAWRCRENALSYVRGTLEASYQKLPSYLFTLQQKNPGTLTDFVTEEDRFKYCFFSLGVSRRGFRTCRPVLCVDDTFLKTKYGGQMLYAVTLDANNHLYPVAFGIVDSENHDSWKYFMSKLKEAIGEVEDLAFVSDRHASITHALETIFPAAYHCACYHHISMNVVAKFKTGHCHVLMYNAAYAFRKSEFHANFEKIKSKDPAIAQYLEGMDFDKWSRAYFPGNRYNKMTSNYAESFNNKTWDARSFPITTFVEFIRFTLQSWFWRHEFHVLDGELNGEVDLLNKTCTCGVFQIIGIPCAHALSGSLKRGVNFYSLCSNYYKIETWRSSYTESIYPTGNEEEWIVPHDIKTIKVRTPAQKNSIGRSKKKQGRLKMKRHPSNGRATCKVRV